MKKYFILALSAIALIGLSGCEPKNPGENSGGNTDGAKVVKISKNQLSLGIDQTEKLTATLDPIPASTVKIVWVSDDETVATVSNGVVTGVAEGIANIIASAEGYASDTCIVTITNDAVYDNFQIGGYSLWNMADVTPLLPEDTVLKFPIGEMHCNVGIGYGFMWDNNIVFDGEKLSGAGIMAYLEFPCYFISESGAYYGYPVDGGGFSVFETENLELYNAAPGTIDEQVYGDFFKLRLTKDSLTEEDEDMYFEAFTGAQLYYIDFTKRTQSYNLGNVMNGSLFFEDYDENMNSAYLYDAKIQWFDYLSNDRLYGLKVNLEQEGEEYFIKDLVEPYDMRYVEKNYKNYDFSSAAAKFAQPKRQYRIMENTLKGTQAEQQLKNMRREALKNTFLLKH